MNNEGTSIEKAIEKVHQIHGYYENREEPKMINMHGVVEMLQSMLPEEKSQLEQAYEEGTKYEYERLDFEEFYKSIKLNK